MMQKVQIIYDLDFLLLKNGTNVYVHDHHDRAHGGRVHDDGDDVHHAYHDYGYVMGIEMLSMITQSLQIQQPFSFY